MMVMARFTSNPQYMMVVARFTSNPHYVMWWEDSPQIHIDGDSDGGDQIHLKSPVYDGFTSNHGGGQYMMVGWPDSP